MIEIKDKAIKEETTEAAPNAIVSFMPLPPHVFSGRAFVNFSFLFPINGLKPTIVIFSLMNETLFSYLLYLL